MLIPHERLSDEALCNLIEEFVTREGTDYGPEEIPLAEKTRQVRAQLERGEAVILFDEDSGSVTLRTRRELKQLEGLADDPDRNRKKA